MDNILKEISKHQEMLKNIIRKYAYNAQDIDDILQEFYIHCYDYKKITKEYLFPTGELNKKLLYVVVANFVRDYYRKQDRYYMNTIPYSNFPCTSSDTSDEKSTFKKHLEVIAESIDKDDAELILVMKERKLKRMFIDENGELDSKGYWKEYRRLSRIVQELNEMIIITNNINI